MARVKPKLPFASAGSGPRLKIFQADWQRIETAYGLSLPSELRRKVLKITREYLQEATLEKRAPIASQAEDRVKAIKNAAGIFRDAVLRCPSNIAREVDFYARQLISKHARLPFQGGRDGLQNLAFEARWVLNACNLAMAELKGLEKGNFREGEAWDRWIRNLTKLMRHRKLPIAARKDTDKQMQSSSPFVFFIGELQKCIPAEYRRSTQSQGALAQAIYSTRAAARRERKALRPGLNKSRIPPPPQRFIYASGVRRDADALAGAIPADGGEDYMEQLLYTISQSCQLAAIGRTKFYELVASGEIPIRKVGKKTLVAASDLKRWAKRLPAIEAKPADRTEVKAGRR